MLIQAVHAGIPMIGVQTGDLLNVSRVLRHIVGREIYEWKDRSTIGRKDTSPKFAPETLYYVVCTKDQALGNTGEIYRALVDHDSQMIIVNPPDSYAEVFDAGALGTPVELVEEVLSDVTDSMDEVLPALGGLSLKEATEVVRLTQARDGALTADGLVRSRQEVPQFCKGVQAVKTHDGLGAYLQPEWLANWVAKEKQFFLHSRDERLVPRGLLFDGPPGTGKTMAAKYLAYELAVPLYRLDVSGVKGKYVGESESSFSEALRRIESSAPCVVLLDEVEKLFAGNDTSGVTQGILASLLWWLQEHGSRVLTVMTTNKVSTVPAELYRPGRIDEVYKFSLLEKTAAQKLAKFILKTYDVKCTVKVLNEALSMQGGRLSHSEVAKVVKSVVKDALGAR